MLLNIPSITSIFILVVGGLYLLLLTALKKGFPLDRIGVIFLLWLAPLAYWATLSCLNFGALGLVGFREWIRLASLFMIYALSYHIAHFIDYRKIIRYIFFALPIPLLVGLYQICVPTGKKIYVPTEITAAKINRIASTFAHPNSFSLFMVLFMGITLWKIIVSRQKAWWIILLFVEAFVLINAFSLGSMIMLFVAMVVLALNMMNMKRRIALIAFLIVALVGFALHPSGQKRFQDIPAASDVVETVRSGKYYGEGSFAWRMLNWHLLLGEWRKKPLCGYGLATTIDLISPLKNVPHNDYLRFLVETGLTGLAMFLYLLTNLGQQLWKVYRRFRKDNIEISYLALIMFSVYAAWMVGSFADNFITVTAFQYYFWSLTGVLMAQNRRLITGRKKAA
jgi:O-antigen ligase